MINLRYICVIVTCLLVVSCQKDELPEGTTGTPQFSSSYTFNGETYNLSAGEMGLVQSSVSDTSGSGIVLTGMLANSGCPDCGPGFKLTVNSPEGYTYSPSSNLQSNLDEWDYAINPDQDSTYVFDLLASSGNPSIQGDWYLNGEQLNFSPVDSIHLQLSDPGTYTLTFNSTLEPCNLSVTRDIEFDGQNIPCYGNILQIDTIVPYYFVATAGETFNPNTTNYTWFYGDSSVTTGNSNILSLDSINPINQMCVEMTDNVGGCSANACIDFGNSPIGGNSCIANILLNNPDLIPVAPASGFANTILEITDNSGTVYSSVIGSQTNSTVTLLSAEDYTEPTMPDVHFIKVSYQIDCLLFDSSGNGYPFSGTIASAFEAP